MSEYTTTTLTTFIREVLEPDIQKTFSDGTETWDFIPDDGYTMGTEWRWPVESSLGSGATYTTEGTTAPDPSSSTDVKATQTYQTIQAAGTVTGEVISALRNGGEIAIQALEKAIRDKVREVQNKTDDYANAQIIDAIDDDTTVYGLNRSTYALASYVVAGGSAALTEAMLGEASMGSKVRPYSMPQQGTVIISSPEQARAYANITGGQYGEHNFVWTSADTKYDISKLKATMAYGDIPWKTLPGLTNTYVFGVHLPLLKKRMKAPIHVIPLGKDGYFDKFDVVTEIAVAYMNPQKAFRIEALTVPYA